jgi:catechol 2,3-dioxygenase-like lactoylglutathione lyase family enzyme
VRIGKLFHLTLLVDDYDGPERFFNGIFSPLCIMRGYSSFWHRDGGIYIIAETSIEPMHVYPPREGEQGTSWYRFMERYGPRVHNLAFYVDDYKELARRLEAAGVRTTMAGTDSTVFAHPKDTPGMLEFQQPSDSRMRDPRFTAVWDDFRREFWPNTSLGLERMSHVTVLVHDLDKATSFFTNVLDATTLDETRATIDASDVRYVLVGDDTVLELSQPLDEGSAAGRELAEVGQGAVGVTFKVRDVPAAESWLQLWEAPVARVEPTQIVLDRARTWGVEYRFTTEPLAGDPRT